MLLLSTLKYELIIYLFLEGCLCIDTVTLILTSECRASNLLVFGLCRILHCSCRIYT